MKCPDNRSKKPRSLKNCQTVEQLRAPDANSTKLFAVSTCDHSPGPRASLESPRMTFSPGRIFDAAFRIGYLCAMYSGLRAVSNRIQALMTPPLRSASLNRMTMQLPGGETVVVAVHRRPTAPTDHRHSGMISVRLVVSHVRHPLYSLFCLTSHFGCGHIEIAFYECEGRIVLYAVRNILKSNAERIGVGRLFEAFPLQANDDEISVLQQIREVLHQQGLETSFASPDECVALAVDNRLLHPARQARARAALKRKYTRLWGHALFRQSLQQ